MDITQLQDIAQSCIFSELPPCACACPLNVDVHALIQKVKEGSFAAAYKAYAKHVLFPNIVSRVCSEPCKAKCVRGPVDASISLRLLEKACCDFMANPGGGSYFIPPKKYRILVVGGGMAGLACAVKLAQRGYPVQLIEKNDRLGGGLAFCDPAILLPEVLREDTERASSLDNLSIHLNETATNLADYAFDAALIATGNSQNPLILPEKRDGIFVLPPQAERDALRAIKRGFSVSYDIEGYFRTGVTAVKEETRKDCKFQRKPETITPKLPAVLENPTSMTQPEAMAEAERCLLCHCQNCLEACEMLEAAHKSPEKVMIDINATLFKTLANTKVALKEISSCTLCGLCEKVCPSRIDFKEILVESRRQLQQSKAMPPAYYEFWLNDMAFSNGENAALYAVTPHNPHPAYLFFPGCQLGASDPEYVLRGYAALTEHVQGGAALMLRCCGAPAYWAGKEEEHQAALAPLRDAWKELGEPVIVPACPSCLDMFRRFLPEARTVSLWDIPALHGLHALSGQGARLSVFDPCSTRNTPETQGNIRKMLQNAGYALDELPMHGEYAKCCGYGGLIYGANPDLHAQIVTNDIRQSDNDYAAYCVNCRDTFALAGKPAYHVLDVMFFADADRKHRLPPDLSERRENRIRLKKRLTKELLGVEFQEIRPNNDIQLHIPPDLAQKMEAKLILKDNVKQCIAEAEATGNKLYNPADASFTTHRRQGTLTFWVVYRKEGNAYTLLNVYKHRMQIEGEGE